MITCLNHPTRMATTRCKRCGKPLCNDCKMVSEVGVVCSEECLDAIKTFQEHVKEDLPYASRRRWLSRGAVKGLLAVAALLAGAYGILCWRAGSLLTLSGLREQLAYFGRFLGTYF